MSYKFTLLCFFVAFSISVTAQVEQVAVGASYSQQAYYKLSTGEVTTISNSAWDIAFSSIGQQDAGIFINESAGSMDNPVKLFVAEENDWNTVISNISIFTDETRIHNEEKNWSEGAFNSIKDPNSVFDYGWGKYNPALNQVIGDKIFVIQKRDESFIKLQIQKLNGENYEFRYANLDGTNEITSVVSKNLGGDQSLVYFSLESNAEISIPSDYDLIFQRYTTPLDAGGGVFINYIVTGVLLGPGTRAVVANGVDPETVSETDYANDYSDLITTIGHTWKSFDFNAGWLIQTDQAQFVKTKDDAVFKIVFYDFEGSSTGITTFEKTSLGIVNANDFPVNNLDISLFPNPSSDYITLKGIEKSTDIKILNSTGLLSISKTIDAKNSTINIENLSSGIYFIQFEINGKLQAVPFVVSK